MEIDSRLKILIVEDNAIIAFDLSLILEKLQYQVAGTAESYQEAVVLLETQQIDLVLIDIQLSGVETGIDLAKYIRLKKDIPIIYLTSNSDRKTVNEAKKTSPNGFIVKPFQQDSLFASIETAISNFESTHLKSSKTRVKDVLFVKDKSTYHRVKVNEIQYAKSFRNYVEIYTKSSSYIYRITLHEFLNTLPEKDFIKIHKSYVVNINQIQSISSSEVIVNHKSLPVSPTYKDALMNIVIN